MMGESEEHGMVCPFCGTGGLVVVAERCYPLAEDGLAHIPNDPEPDSWVVRCDECGGEPYAEVEFEAEWLKVKLPLHEEQANG